MTGIIDVGGGLRGIYGAGVFDRCLDEGIEFDCCIGVSAGSANVASFLGKQRGRNYRFYHEYPSRKEYMSLNNLFRCGCFLDLNYIYKVLSNSGGEDPLDYETLCAYQGKAFIVATQKDNGMPHYFEKNDFLKDDYSILIASSAIPVVCKPCKIAQYFYCDGGVSDPVPIEKAIKEGCDKIILILTKPKDFRKDSKRETFLSELLKKSDPHIAKALRESCEKYNRNVELACQMEKQGSCLIIAPDDCCGVDTLTKNKENLHKLYEKGYNDGERIKSFI